MDHHSIMFWHETHDIVVESSPEHYYLSILTYHLTAPFGDDGGFTFWIDCSDEGIAELVVFHDKEITRIPLSLLFEHGYRIIFVNNT